MTNQDERELICLANRELDKLDAINTKLILKNSKLEKQLKEANRIIKLYSRDEFNDQILAAQPNEEYEWLDELPKQKRLNPAQEYLLKWRIK